MASPIVINTGDKQYKNVEIDGVAFKVRNFGAGEQLRISQIQRELKSLSSAESASNQDKSVDLTIEMLGIIKSLFKDETDGKDTDDLFNRLDSLQIAQVISQVFDNGTNEAA